MVSEFVLHYPYTSDLSLSLPLSLLLAVKASLNVKVLDVSPPYWMIFRQIWVHAISVFMVFGVTLSLFPAVIGIIESTVHNPKASHWTCKSRPRPLNTHTVVV